MKQHLLLIVLCCTFQIATAQLNIDTCQAKARANYPLIKQYDLIKQSTEFTLSNANKAYLPQISITAIGGYIMGMPTISLPEMPAKEPEKVQFIGIAQLNQTIWDGGAIHSEKDIASASAEVEKSQVDVSLYTIRERVNQLFFGILLIDEQLKQLDILNDNLNRNLQKVQLSKDNGLAYQTDIDELKSEMISLEQKKIDFNYTRKGYLTMLSYITGMQLNDNDHLEKPVMAESVLSLSNNRPELKVYDNQLKLIDAQTSINKVHNMPKLGLMGAGLLMEPGVNIGKENFGNVGIIGISLSWSTAGLYRNSNNKDLDKIRMDRIISQRETFTFNNNLQLQQTNSDIEKQKAIIMKDDEQVKLKAEITKGYQLKYYNGLCSMNDLIAATSKENEAQSNRALHNVQLLMSIYNYKTISGN